MSSATAQFRVLDRAREASRRRQRDRRGVPREFYRPAFEATRGPWAQPAGADLLSAGTTGHFPDEEFDDLLRLVQLGAAINADPDAAELFTDIFAMRRPWSTLEESPWRERLTPRPARVGSTWTRRTGRRLLTA